MWRGHVSPRGHLREGISSGHPAGSGWFWPSEVAVRASICRCPTSRSWDPGFAKWGEFLLLLWEMCCFTLPSAAACVGPAQAEGWDLLTWTRELWGFCGCFLV